MQEYDRFIALSTLTQDAADEQRRAVFLSAPAFAVVQTDPGPGDELRASLARQTYGRYTLGGPSPLPRGDYYLFLPGGARLAPDALFRLAAAAGGGAELLYADEDLLKNGRRQSPRFKPDFSPHTLLCRDYIGRGFCVSRRLLMWCGWPGPGPARRYGFLLRATEQAERIVHLPFLLFSLPPEPPCACAAPLKAALARRRTPALLLPGPGRGTVLPRFSVRGEPLVSLLLTDEGDPEALKSTLLALEQRLQLPRYEIVLGAAKPLTPFLRALSGAGVPLIRQPGATAGALLNEAARRARGRFLLILKGGCQPLSPDFGQRLTEWADQPGVGAVGPLVLSEGGRVLSCGAVLGLLDGLCAPGFGLPEGALRAWPQLLCPRDTLCLPAWAMMVRRDRFWSVGGFDPALERLALGEELCLRLWRRGLFSLCVPGVRFRFAPPRDAQNAPRGQSLARCRDAFFPLLRGYDPFYNPNLRLDTPLPRPALPPRPPRLSPRADRWPPYFLLPP